MMNQYRITYLRGKQLLQASFLATSFAEAWEIAGRCFPRTIQIQWLGRTDGLRAAPA